MKITHDNGTTDNRYTVTLEHGGELHPYHCARFCGDWLGQFNSEARAWLACAEHKALQGMAHNE